MSDLSNNMEVTKMWNLVRSTILVICISSLAACSSTQTVHQLKNIAMQGKSNVTFALNDKIIINSSPDSSQWWMVYGGKKSKTQLIFELYENNRQQILTFKEAGEFTVTTVKKSSSGQIAPFSRTLTFIVN